MTTKHSETRTAPVRCESWQTSDELGFLDELGTHRLEQRRAPVPRWYLYQQYLNAAEKRHHWGQMKQARVMEQAQRLYDATRHVTQQPKSHEGER